MTALYPNRECGECNVCCYALSIDELKKPPGIVCRHWTKESHCTCYDARPSSCRIFHCGWRALPLGEEWRPDRCGIVIYSAGQGHQFELIGGLDKLFWPPLVNAISDLIAQNVPVYLSASASVGYNSTRVYLNDRPALQTAVADKDFSGIAAALSIALQASIDAPKQKVEFDATHHSAEGNVP